MKRNTPSNAFRLLLEYDGSRYQGWQRQGEKQSAQGVRTVAGTLERILRDEGLKLAQLTGSGRTDAGVHALGQVAHLHLQGTPLPNPRDLQRLLGDHLPSDIALRSVTACSPTFHARHDAMERSYLYQISLRRSAFAKPYLWWVKGRLDLDGLAEAWSQFQGAVNIAAFADLDPGEDPACQIRSCECRPAGSLVLLRVVARHFFRRQVRRMVGAAVQCALKKDSLDRLRQDLDHPTREANLHWGELAAPSAGLFLEGVRYPGDPDFPSLAPAFPVW